ncbi:uncharacterized protein LOC132721617 [Ruditapes philippinarum]|uniref:uncharacterized protein LOC132721617 n=1 Tax=Ruditapes philippinarum TaxID=129788 RepID=UPI00295A64D7|nr:uncharacterized protein LOC132721617 [Ruditapes philippinarum]
MLQQWKLRRYAFLDSYLKPRVLCEELGKDIEDDGTEDGDETGSFDHEEDADLGTTTTTGAIQSIGERTKKKPKTSSSVVNVLQSLLDVTRQDMRAADQRVERLCADEKAKAGDERTAWGQWLTSACLAVPAQSFRQFQRDTFEATMRYLPAVTVAGSPRMPPPSQVFPVSLPAFQQQQPPQLPDQQQSYLSMLHDNEQTTINETTSDNMSSGRSAKTKSTASLIAQAFQAVNIPSVHSSQDLASEARQTQQTMSSSPSTQVEDRSLYPLANQQQK